MFRQGLQKGTSELITTKHALQRSHTIGHKRILAFAKDQMIHAGVATLGNTNQRAAISASIARHMDFRQCFSQVTGILAG